MRTYFEPDDVEQYETSKALLVRRAAAWAKCESAELDPLIVGAALDFRHNGVDGRLGYWTGHLVDEFLLSYLPRTLTLTAEGAAGAPESLRALVRYLHDARLADPTGDPLADLDVAIAKAGKSFTTAMADERNFSIQKFWFMTAVRSGVNPADDEAVGRFFDDVHAGRISVDEEVLAEVSARHFDNPGLLGRAQAQLPVRLPPEAELAEAAEKTAIVGRLRKFAGWVGAGRELTSTGNLKLAAARELLDLLELDDRIDPVIGDRTFRTQSSADLPGLAQVLALAKRIRVVRVVKGRLVPVAKNARVLDDALALWTAAFDALPEPELVTHGNRWAPQYTLLLGELIDETLPDVLNTLYGLPEPTPVVRLAETVWLSITEQFDLGLGEPGETAWRRGIGADLRRVFDVLAEFGAVELTVGEPHPMFRSDLGADPGFVAPMPADSLARLTAALAPDAGPMDLVTLSPLATRAVLKQLRGAGRYAPLIGELAEADPAPLLGQLSEHYSPEAAEQEIDGWLAAHGGRERAFPLLVNAIRDVPFRARRGALLDVVSRAVPDRIAFLQDLRRDRQLGLTATNLLMAEGELAPDDLGEEDGVLNVAEQLIALLEIGGPDDIIGMLDQVPADDGAALMDHVLTSGHPDTAALAELEEIFATRRPKLATVHPLAGVSRRTRKRR